MKVMKVASIVSGTVFAIYAVLLLVQIWSEAISWEVFLKLTVTAAVIIVATFGLAMLYREYVEEKSMRDDKYID